MPRAACGAMLGGTLAMPIFQRLTRRSGGAAGLDAHDYAVVSNYGPTFPTRPHPGARTSIFTVDDL